MKLADHAALNHILVKRKRKFVYQNLRIKLSLLANGNLVSIFKYTTCYPMHFQLRVFRFQSIKVYLRYTMHFDTLCTIMNFKFTNLHALDNLKVIYTLICITKLILHKYTVS